MADYTRKYDYAPEKIGHFFAFYPATGTLSGPLGKLGSLDPSDMHRDNEYFYVLTRDQGVLRINKIPENTDETASSDIIGHCKKANAEGLIVDQLGPRIYLDNLVKRYQPFNAETCEEINISFLSRSTSAEITNDPEYLSVVKVNKHDEDYVILHNSSDKVFDLSSFYLADDNRQFKFNKSYQIAPKDILLIPLKDKKIGLKAKDNEHLRLYTPTGKLLFIDQYRQ